MTQDQRRKWDEMMSDKGDLIETQNQPHIDIDLWSIR